MAEINQRYLHIKTKEVISKEEILQGLLQDALARDSFTFLQLMQNLMQDSNIVTIYGDPDDFDLERLIDPSIPRKWDGFNIKYRDSDIGFRIYHISDNDNYRSLPPNNINMSLSGHINDDYTTEFLIEIVKELKTAGLISEDTRFYERGSDCNEYGNVHSPNPEDIFRVMLVALAVGKTEAEFFPNGRYDKIEIDPEALALIIVNFKKTPPVFQPLAYIQQSNRNSVTKAENPPQPLGA